jgi:predicted permease
MGTLSQDVRYAWRALMKSPGFSALAIITLALGIGANSTIFSWINGTLLNPIPGVTHTADLVTLNRSLSVRDPKNFSYADYIDMRDRTTSFSGLIASAIHPMDITGGARPEHTWGALTSSNYFDVLGVRPLLGRTFVPAEARAAGAEPVVVISYRLWTQRFGSDKNIAGKSMQINQHAYSIIGVMPREFQGSQTGVQVEMWVPVTMQGQLISNYDRLADRGVNWLILQGRLKPGVTPEQAQADMTTLMARLAADYPDDHKSETVVTAYPLWRGPFGANGYLYVLFPMLMAISGFVLLLACANVANLILVRSVGRKREIAIRLSVGATRWRLVRQFLVESMLLAVLAGGVAMLMTAWTAGSFSRFIPPSGIPIVLNISANGKVLLVTFLISLLAGVIFGVLPAMRASDLSPMAVLKEDSGSSTGSIRKARLSSVLVVAQIALSLLLLVCSGLFIRSFRAAQTLDPGFNPKNVFVASYSLFPAGYKHDDGIEFHRQLLARIQQIPGVESVTLADWVPLGYSTNSTAVGPAGYVAHPHESMDVSEATIGPDYLKTLQIPLVAGREFTPNDGPKAEPVAIVNEVFVDRYWHGETGIGKKVDADGMHFTVVGVSKTAKYDAIGEDPKPIIYLPILQDYTALGTIQARVNGDPAAFARAIEKAVHAQNADMPIFDESTLEQRVAVASTGQRIAGTFVGAFGVLALVLAAVGIYGVVSYTTRQRTHEIGIRLALGAQRLDVFRLVLGNGVRLIFMGLVIGFAMCLALTRFLSSILFHTGATDVVTFAAVGLLLTAVALLACYLPARRAMSVDPMVALRFQ